MSIKLVPVIHNDVEQLSAMAGRAFDSESVSALVKDNVNLSLIDTRTALESRLPSLVKVCYFSIRSESSQELLGMIGLYSLEWTNRNIAYLGWFFVDPKVQGKGVGRAALNVIARKAIELGKSSIRVEVDASDLDVIAFYEKCGFEREAVVKSYFFDDVDMQLMRKIL